ncbi:cupin domain-containing protein [Fibrella forsythiae]|uniref:Cupin domain-containing protein n=1 Tax=Fibrella forsythiae TaxID=2817061 RepID=A0ABS3JRI1_9BACT|nr:cupin domain-containing protein [Fibrella forsythiae]MBO0952599.1 cupin domain-containing protein [Fibrella forsythiae]
MNITYPHTIENCIGEKLIFREVRREADGDRVIVENFVAPGSGPPMHVHRLQDEGLTVISGRIGYQIQGQSEQFAEEGETVVFERGVPHRFWNAGTQTLHCTGWINPANSVVFFLSAIYAAQNKSGKAQPEVFDAAFLLTRYAAEFDMVEIPRFVRTVIIPVTYQIGRLLGKYTHFKNAPEPLPTSSQLAVLQ